MHIIKYYEILNHKPTASYLRYNPVVKNFKLECDAIKEHKKKEVKTPQISQKLDIILWTEAFLDFLSRIVGSRNIHLACVVQTIDILDYDTPFELMNDTCCTECAGSLEEELIKRESQSHSLFKEDDATVY